MMCKASSSPLCRRLAPSGTPGRRRATTSTAPTACSRSASLVKLPISACRAWDDVWPARRRAAKPDTEPHSSLSCTPSWSSFGSSGGGTGATVDLSEPLAGVESATGACTALRKSKSQICDLAYVRAHVWSLCAAGRSASQASREGASRLGEAGRITRRLATHRADAVHGHGKPTGRRKAKSEELSHKFVTKSVKG